MDRPLPPQTEHPTAVPTVGPVSLNLLLGSSPRERREPLAAAPDRRTLPGSPVLRQSQDGRRTQDQSQKRSTTDAPDGHRGSLRQTEPEPSGSWPSYLNLPSARAADRAGSPSVEHRYHLQSATAGFPVSGGHRGLVQPLRLELGAFQHVGCPLLFGGFGRRVGPVWTARNLELRPGLAIHLNCVFGSSAGAGGRHQHGRAGTGARQRFYRTGVAFAQVRTDLSGGFWLR